jgi:hypothetical protein
MASLAALGCSSAPVAGEHTSIARQAVSRAPRIWLTGDVVQRLVQRSAANDPTWTALKKHCDSLTGGSFNPPGSDAYPNFPNVGQGYQGDGYVPEVLALGLCYVTASAAGASNAAAYGSAGDKLLAAVSTPAGSGGQPPNTDDGYGIRNYGVAMAVGYDWLYPALSAATKTQVASTLDAWIDWYDKSGFIHSEPIGNYFVGYLLAKTTAAIALAGDDPSSATYWSDVQTRMWGQLVQPSYTSSMKGGGWPEGWQYGPLSVSEVAEFLWAAKTGQSADYGSQLPQARDQSAYIAQFAWPSRKHMDDQGTVHAQAALHPSGCAALVLAGVLEYSGDAYAPAARSLANDLLTANGQSCPEWQTFLYGDPAAPATPSYAQNPISYFAPGPNQVAARSSWQTDAVWASFVSGQYIDATDSGEQYFNQGAVAVVEGDQPILVNATGWLPQAGGDSGESFVYDDTWGNRTRLLNNTFYVSGLVQTGAVPSESSTHIEHYEDLSLVVHARGRQLEQQYSSGTMTQWTRDFAYVRPGTVVVYDRTTVADGAADQWLAWHTPTQPVPGKTADPTQARYDVQVGGATIGSVRQLAPSSPTAMTASLVGGAAWRLELHSSGASQDWLTAITAGADVPDQVRLSTADGNVTSGAMTGVHVLGTPNQVVLFGADHAAAATVTSATYHVRQTASATHVLFDLAPSTSGYRVEVTGTGGQFSIAVAAGGDGVPSGNGTLVFDLAMDGSVTFPSKPSAGGPDGGVVSEGGALGGSSGGSVGSGSSSGSASSADSGIGKGEGPGTGTGPSNDAGGSSSGLEDAGGAGGGCALAARTRTRDAVANPWEAAAKTIGNGAFLLLCAAALLLRRGVKHE